LFYGLSEGNKWLVVRIFLLVFLVFCLSRPKLRAPVILAILAFPLANEVCDLLKNGLMMPRPSVDFPEAIVRVNRLTSFGTASAHSANMMAVATAFFIYARPWGWGWLVIAILTGISRVYVGVHYPYQVLFGWLVGAGVAFGLAQIWELIKKRRGLQNEDHDDQLPESSAV
jgi:undecaprenyl-diphosphatase